MTGAYWGFWISETTTSSVTYPDTWTRWYDSTSTATTTTDLATWRAIRASAEMQWHWWQTASRGPAIHVAPPRVDPLVAAEARRQEELKRQSSVEATQRAEELLLGHLSEEQAAGYRDQKKFRVVGQDGHIYEVNCKKHHQNIRRLEGDRAVEEFCIYMRGAIPLADNLLAQKLMLECDIQKLKEIANRFEVRDMRRQA